MVIISPELANASRPELLQRIAEVCYNSEEPFDHEEWDSVEEDGQPKYSDDDLRSVVALTNEELFTLFQPIQGKGHCYLLKRLYDYIRIRAITVNPLTLQPLTQMQRTTIINAMRAFFPENMEEINQAENFVNQLFQGHDDDSDDDDFDDDYDDDDLNEDYNVNDYYLVNTL